MKSNQKMTLLVVEDDATLVVVYEEYLHEEPCYTTYVETGTEALAAIQKQVPDVILLDLGLPDMNGIDILKYINEHQLPCLVVVVTAQGSVDVAVAAMRYKAVDFIEKPFDGQRLIVTIRSALRRRQLEKEVDNYKKEVEHYKKLKRKQYYNFIGSSTPMQAVYHIIESAASSKATVFITGESGTGKELCAEAIHKQSPRWDKPLVTLNCAAIPKELMESEIFGHVKGAFTGAVIDRQGAAFQADGGTLFLDEIGDMDFDLQTKLLRFIQTGVVQKVGSNKPQNVDVRFICATNRDPLIDVQEGRFREDLYYRLHVIPISLPSLRERGEDILLISEYFLKKYSLEEKKSFTGFSPETENILLHYHWPGNVRQLENVIRNIVVLHEGKEVTSKMLPAPLNRKLSSKMTNLTNTIQKNMMIPTGVINSSSHSKEEMPSKAVSLKPDTILPLWEVEKDAIEKAIEFCEGSVSKAAALLDVSPSTLYRKRQGWET